MLVIHVYGQDQEVIKLQQQINQHPQQDTFRVNRLNDLAAIISLGAQQRDSIANEALALSKKINYPRGIMRALQNLANTRAEQGENQQALALMKQAYALAEKNEDKEYQVIMLLTMGRITGLTVEMQQAINYYFQAETIAKDLPDKKWLARCQSAIGNRYLIAASNYPKSMEWLLKSIATAEEAGCQECLYFSWNNLGTLYTYIGDYEKALVYYEKVLNVSKSRTDASNASILTGIGECYRKMGKYPEAIKYYEEALTIAKDLYTIELIQSNLADVYVRMNNLPLAFSYGFLSLNGAKKIQDVEGAGWIYGILARACLKKNKADSALYYAKLGLDAANQTKSIEFMRDNYEALANAYVGKKDFENAYRYNNLFILYRDSMLNAEVTNKTNLLQYNSSMDKAQAQITTLDQQRKNQQNFLISSLIVLLLIIITAILLLRNNRHKQKANQLLQKQKQLIDDKAHELSVQKDNLQQSYSNVELLGEIGRKITSSLSVEKIISTAYGHVNLLMDAAVFGIGIYNDELKRIEFPATYENGEALPFYYNLIDDKNRFAAICFTANKEIIMGDLDKEYKDYIQEVPAPHAGGQAVSLIFLPLVVQDKRLGVITVQSFRQNAYSEYQLFMLRNICIYTAIALENATSYEELNQTIVSLKQAQVQLIQSEKMASLGELTAGIAHEIQNPLNFVNNFSEVSNELLDEMKTELSDNNKEDAIRIADDVKQNLEKIIHHGKRADAIVKGMLQHSRISTGQKELTDINALTDEYLRLSYHGLRAKDKSFNTEIKTDFDDKIGKIPVVPQDIGRVLLNLYNNAFYAVNEKKKLLADGYQPITKVTTRKQNDKIEISVEDNGNGIPQNTIDKIFQPFFTTKPTGQGTGLGLSLSYDIIKAHGGEIKVET